MALSTSTSARCATWWTSPSTWRVSSSASSSRRRCRAATRAVARPLYKNKLESLLGLEDGSGPTLKIKAYLNELQRWQVSILAGYHEAPAPGSRSSGRRSARPRSRPLALRRLEARGETADWWSRTVRRCGTSRPTSSRTRSCRRWAVSPRKSSTSSRKLDNSKEVAQMKYDMSGEPVRVSLPSPRRPLLSSRLAAVLLVAASLGASGLAPSPARGADFRAPAINGGLLLTVDVIRATSARPSRSSSRARSGSTTRWPVRPAQPRPDDHLPGTRRPAPLRSHHRLRTIKGAEERDLKNLVVIADYKYRAPRTRRRLHRRAAARPLAGEDHHGLRPGPRADGRHALTLVPEGDDKTPPRALWSRGGPRSSPAGGGAIPRGAPRHRDSPHPAVLVGRHGDRHRPRPAGELHSRAARGRDQAARGYGTVLSLGSELARTRAGPARSWTRRAAG